MKKYWKLIFLIMFVLLTIGSFYVKANTLSKHFPAFVFETIEGEERAIEDLIVNGDLFRGMSTYESFQVSHEGTSYFRDEPFAKRLKGYYPDTYIAELQKQYKSFMRGKAEDSSLYYEDGNILAYGATPYDIWTFDNYRFDIAVLDKQTNETISFSLPIPNRGEYWHVEPHGVFVDGSELSIITVNEIMGNDMTENTASAHIYSFDIEKEELIDEQTIGNLDYSMMEHGHNDIRILVEQENILIAEQHFRYIDYPEQSDYYGETVTTNKLIAYNWKTKAEEEISLPNEAEIGMPIAIKDGVIYFANIEGKKLKVISYNGGEKSISGEREVELINNNVSGSDIAQSPVENGKFYFVPSPQDLEQLTSITVIDLDSLTVDYHGKVEASHAPRQNETAEMHFYYPELKN